MIDAETELAAIDRDIARAERRIAELEALAADDTPHGASPTLVRALVAEWRGNLQAMQDRREALLRTITNPLREALSPALTSTTRPSPRSAVRSAAMLIELYGAEVAAKIAVRLAAEAESAGDVEAARTWRLAEEFVKRMISRAERRS